jgi:hypothetical protein
MYTYSLLTISNHSPTLSVGATGVSDRAGRATSTNSFPDGRSLGQPMRQERHPDSDFRRKKDISVTRYRIFRSLGICSSTS